MIETRVLLDVVQNYFAYMSDILSAENAKKSLSQVSIRLVRLRRQRLPTIKRMRAYQSTLFDARAAATNIVSFNNYSYDYFKTMYAADMAELVYKMDHDAIMSVKDTLTEIIAMQSKDKETLRAFNFVRAVSARYVFGCVADSTIKCKACKQDIQKGEPIVSSQSGKVVVHLIYACITRESAPPQYYHKAY